MTRLQSLKKHARQSCIYRGHQMSNFKQHEYFKNQYYSNCKVCNAQVVVTLQPTPNGIDIGGEAVGLNCPVHKAERKNHDR